MKQFSRQRKHLRGSSLIEVLVTLVILMLGLLGLVGLMVQSQRSQMESYQRMQALVLLDDMVNRININRKVVSCYAFTTGTDGTPFLGTGSTLTPICASGTTEQQALALQDMADWNNLLQGMTEQTGGTSKTNVGGVVGARGCVQLMPDGVSYQVSVVWQGNSKTAAPAGVSCATGLYDTVGADAQRRAVSVNIQITSLS